mmetsp:Transcript_32003/g.95855  ORF Transcript_32003/g.95855 Transcript_32003/m.95855 type:complete len:129 (-) Transcript_32003:41-427(-)
MTGSSDVPWDFCDITSSSAIMGSFLLAACIATLVRPPKARLPPIKAAEWAAPERERATAPERPAARTRAALKYFTIVLKTCHYHVIRNVGPFDVFVTQVGERRAEAEARVEDEDEDEVRSKLSSEKAG